MCMGMTLNEILAALSNKRAANELTEHQYKEACRAARKVCGR